MEIWLDTIDLDAIEHAAKTGVIAGVTTNPSILSGSHNVPYTLEQMLKLQKGPVAAQVTSDTIEGMVAEGIDIHSIAPGRMFVKVPVNPNGLAAMRELREKNIPILATGIFHPLQVLLAANLGAAYAAPYYGHIGEIGNALDTLKTMADILKAQHLPTKIMGAALKSPEDIVTCATLGIEAVTVKAELYYKTIAEHHLLKKFNQLFISDWSNTQGDKSISQVILSMLK